VIDDDPLFRTLIVTQLRKSYIIAIASEGSEGFQKALITTPDIAIIDVNMPGWDGLKTLEAFRKHPELCHVKIIMLTGDSTKQTVIKAVQAGADSYILKSNFSAENLLEKVSSLSQSNAPASRGVVSSPAVQNAAPQPTATPEPVMSAATATAATDAVDEEMQAMLDDWD